METYKIFIVEDDIWYAEILKYHLSLNPEYNISCFSTGKECLANLYQHPDIITIDFSLPDYTGDKLYQKIKEADNQIPVIAISGQEEIAVAVNLLKMGIKDYLIKNESTKDLLWNSIINIREMGKLKKEVEALKKELGEKFSFEKSIKGQSTAIKRIFGLMEKAGKTNINIFISGETGTGKEVVAKAIHYNSERKSHPFVAVNMAAIPRELIESELFGHEKGAFTGAVTKKAGKFEQANGGTIFLDEIAELDLSLQSKLLRVLQERETIRVGGHEKIKLDVRLIVATHKNLAEEVKKGLFREDLFYRIIGLPIELPPLRERGGDILILAKYFVEEFTKENNMGIISLSQEGQEKLLRYNYPGNVRELKSIIELAAVMCNDNEIKAADITYTTTEESGSFISEEKKLRQYTCDIIKYFLKKYDDDVITVANKLDIGKSTIYKMIKEKEITI